MKQIIINRLTLPETLAAINGLDAQLRVDVDGDTLILNTPQTPPVALKNAIRAHKPKLIKYVSAFGGVWPKNVYNRAHGDI